MNFDFSRLNSILVKIVNTSCKACHISPCSYICCKVVISLLILILVIVIDLPNPLSASSLTPYIFLVMSLPLFLIEVTY